MSYNQMGTTDSDDDLRAASFAAKKEEKQAYTWQELQEIEARRRAILKRIELPFWRILTFWDGTCLRVLSRDILLWLTLGLYAFVRVQARIGGLPDFVVELGNTDIGVIGAFLSFFLVLFVNQSNIRFNEMYKTSMSCEAKIFDVASVVSTTMPRANALRLIRYMNAAHVAGYVGLSRTYTKSSFFDQLNKSLKLLTPSELRRVEELQMDYSGDCFRELIAWCMMEIQVAEKEKLTDARQAGMLREKVINFRSSMDSIYDFSDQPIHFFYIHFLSLLSTLYLPLFAVDNAYSAGIGAEVHWSADVVAGLIVMLQSIFVIGLRVLGQKNNDPYGDDLEDLSVLHYVQAAWETSNRILSARFPDKLDPEEEVQLDRTKKNLGYAWASTRSSLAEKEVV